MGLLTNSSLSQYKRDGYFPPGGNKPLRDSLRGRYIPTSEQQLHWQLLPPDGGSQASGRQLRSMEHTCLSNIQLISVRPFGKRPSRFSILQGFVNKLLWGTSLLIDFERLSFETA